MSFFDGVVSCKTLRSSITHGIITEENGNKLFVAHNSCIMCIIWGDWMNIKENLKHLTSLSGLSGAEGSLSQVLCQKLRELGLEASCDSYGNVHGFLSCDKKDAKTLLLEAHMDQIGLMVSEIKENGYIKFVNLGGVDQRILPGMEVMIHGKEPVYGVIGACLHKTKEEEDEKNPKLEEYRIDTGLTEKEVREQISVGDFVQLQSSTVELLHGIISGPAMDNRAGIVSILDCVERLQAARPFYHVYVLFSTQEELGLHGAYTGVQGKEFDGAIVVDVTHGTTPDAKEEVGVFPLGSGAVICRGPNFHYSYTKQLISLAKEKGIPYEVEVASAESGTTAWAIQTANGGIPAMLISVPLRYMHTNVETLQCKDIEAVAELLYYAAMGGVEIA